MVISRFAHSVSKSGWSMCAAAMLLVAACGNSEMGLNLDAGADGGRSDAAGDVSIMTRTVTATATESHPDAGSTTKTVTTTATDTATVLCEKAGGTCVASGAGNCRGGRFTNDSCGAREGVECCIGGNTGTSTATQTGSATSTAMTCSEAGGTCIAAYPNACPTRWSDYSCERGQGTRCCITASKTDTATATGTGTSPRTRTETSTATATQTRTGLTCGEVGGTCVATGRGSCESGIKTNAFSCEMGTQCCVSANLTGTATGTATTSTATSTATLTGASVSCADAGGRCVATGRCSGLTMGALSCGDGIGTVCCMSL